MMKRNRHGLTAIAKISGSDAYPGIHGCVRFNQMHNGVLVTAEICGLPSDSDHGNGIYAFHIHSGNRCCGNSEDPFADADGHYDPAGRRHPYHAGDLPPLFGNHGYAYMSVLTDRFSVDEIIGHVVIIHRNIDDFTTQPSGNAGAKIACGKILPQTNCFRG